MFDAKSAAEKIVEETNNALVQVSGRHMNEAAVASFLQAQSNLAIACALLVIARAIEGSEQE